MRIITRDKEYYSSLVRLAVPVALQGLITFLVTFADNLMVNSLGDAAVSGVYMGSQIQTLLQMFTSGIGSTIVIISAQYWGKNDVQRMQVITATGIRAALVAGFVFTAIGVAFPGEMIRLFTEEEAVIAEGAVSIPG